MRVTDFIKAVQTDTKQNIEQGISENILSQPLQPTPEMRTKGISNWLEFAFFEGSAETFGSFLLNFSERTQMPPREPNKPAWWELPIHILKSEGSKAIASQLKPYDLFQKTALIVLYLHELNLHEQLMQLMNNIIEMFSTSTTLTFQQSSALICFVGVSKTLTSINVSIDLSEKSYTILLKLLKNPDFLVSLDETFLLVLLQAQYQAKTLIEHIKNNEVDYSHIMSKIEAYAYSKKDLEPQLKQKFANLITAKHELGGPAAGASPDPEHKADPHLDGDAKFLADLKEHLKNTVQVNDSTREFFSKFKEYLTRNPDPSSLFDFTQKKALVQLFSGMLLYEVYWYKNKSIREMHTLLKQWFKESLSPAEQTNLLTKYNEPKLTKLMYQMYEVNYPENGLFAATQVAPAAAITDSSAAKPPV
jgi:hypothetical protein